MSTTRSPETNFGTVTSWLPLLTDYSAPPACSSFIGSDGSLFQGLPLFTDPGSSLLTDLSCFPEAVTQWFTQYRASANAYTATSLGPFACPSAYYTVTTSSKDSSSTLIYCCPSSYYAVDTSYCEKAISADSTISILYYNTTATPARIVPVTTHYTFATTANALMPYGWAFAEDGVGAAPTATSTGGMNTAIGTGSTAASSVGVSKSTKIAIGVGVGLSALLVIAVVAGIIFFLRYRRMRGQDRSSYQPTLQGSPFLPEKPEYNGAISPTQHTVTGVNRPEARWLTPERQ